MDNLDKNRDTLIDGEFYSDMAKILAKYAAHLSDGRRPREAP
jgi:hypothetical protein